MDTSSRRFIRLAIVIATAAGVALASPVVAVADESEVSEVTPAGEDSGSPVVIVPTTEPLVIELVVEGNPPTDSTESPDGAESEEPAEEDTASTSTDFEPMGANPSPMIAALEANSGGDDHTGGTGGTEEEHTEGGGTDGEHTGGTGGEHTGGGTGDPYRMIFEVSWRLPDDSVIPVLDDPTLPTDWRTIFDLAAKGEMGNGESSAHCTYPAGSTDLVCEFGNPGQHESVTDAMIVRAKPTATYSVTVLWPTSGWTIDGANADGYSARDLCPRGGGGGGGGQGGGHDSGHGETLEAAALEDSGSLCLHTVVMRKSAATPQPPPAEPPAQDPPVSEEPPQSQTPVPPEATATTPTVEVLPVAVTPRTLPATGNTATTTLMVGALILALGGCLSLLARRRNDLPLN